MTGLVTPVTAPDPTLREPVPWTDAFVPTSLTLTRIVILHLLPGVLAGLVFVLASGPVASAGFPPLMALLVAIVVVIVPFELGTVVRAGRRQPGSVGLLAAVPYRRPLGGRTWAWLLPLLLVVAILGFGLLAVVEPPIRDGLFGWLPAWYLQPLPVDAVGSFSRSAWLITIVLYVALNVVIGPIVEELYFRGYLLPRMGQFGRAAPLVNVALFSLYHVWSPWQFLSRIAGVTPFAYAVWRRQNVFLGMAVHVLLNGIGTLSVIALVLQRLP
jgi:uncharacterized protein